MLKRVKDDILPIDDLLFNTGHIDWSRVILGGNKILPNDSFEIEKDKGYKEDGSFNNLKYVNEYQHDVRKSDEWSSFNSRSRLVNERAKANMIFYLPRSMRINAPKRNELLRDVICRECGQKNTAEMSWCLFCGVPLIAECDNGKSNDIRTDERDNHEIISSKLNDFQPIVWRHVDVEEINARRAPVVVKINFGTMETRYENVECHLDVGESIKRHVLPSPVVVPTLDLSALESHRNEDLMSYPSTIVPKKPSLFSGDRLGSIGITVYRCNDESSEGVCQIVNNPEKRHIIVDPSKEPQVIIERPRVIIGRENDSAGSPWQCLAAEVWIEVMTCLSHDQLSRLQQTCRRIYHIGLHSSLWKSVNVNGRVSLNNDHIGYIAEKRPKELHFENCFGTNITPNGLLAMFRICGEGLRKISFKSCSKGAFENDLFLALSAAFCPNVTHVNASYLMNLRDDTLQKMLEGYSQIVSLKVMGAHSISNKSVHFLVDRHRASLTHLDLYGCFKLNSQTLTLLERCPNLRSLALGSINSLKRLPFLKMLKKLSQLTSLDLRGTINLVDDSLLQQICLSCPKLQQMILTNSCRVSDIGVTDLARSCVSKSLRVLDVCGCSKVTESGLEMLLKHCTVLEDLDISCTGIRKEVAKYFKMYAPPRLRCLRVNNNKFISPGDLLSLISACKKLRTLYMYGSTSIGSWRPLEEQCTHITFKHE